MNLELDLWFGSGKCLNLASAKLESSDIERLTIHSSTILKAPRQSQVKPTETRGRHRICVQDGKLSQ